MKQLISFLIFFIFTNYVKSQSILIDPGHGGSEEGAKVLSDNELPILEKDLSLKLSFFLKKELSDLGYETFLSREDDSDHSLATRAMMATELDVDLFLSIHFNWSPSKDANGFEVYYLTNKKQKVKKKIKKENPNHLSDDSSINDILLDLIVDKTSNNSEKLAQNIFENLEEGLFDHSMEGRSIKEGNFYVLALSKTPGVLIELGFMSNKKDLKQMTNDQFLIDAAKSIASGVRSFF